jgi:hypothetical protein
MATATASLLARSGAAPDFANRPLGESKQGRGPVPAQGARVRVAERTCFGVTVASIDASTAPKASQMAYLRAGSVDTVPPGFRHPAGTAPRDSGRSESRRCDRLGSPRPRDPDVAEALVSSGTAQEAKGIAGELRGFAQRRCVAGAAMRHAAARRQACTDCPVQRLARESSFACI